MKKNDEKNTRRFTELVAHKRTNSSLSPQASSEDKIVHWESKLGSLIKPIALFRCNTAQRIWMVHYKPMQSTVVSS